MINIYRYLLKHGYYRIGANPELEIMKFDIKLWPKFGQFTCYFHD